MATATSWWLISPVGESQGTASAPVVPVGTILYSTPASGATYTTLLNDGTITVNGKQYQTFTGPFPSEAAAKSSKLVSGLSWIGTELEAGVGTITNTGVNAEGNTASDVGGGGVAGLNNLLNLPTFENLRPFMVRVVKVVLGGVLIIAGMTMLVKQETNISVSDVAKVAAL